MENETPTNEQNNIGDVSGSVEYIQLLSTGAKAYWDEKYKHYVSDNKRFHISLEAALCRSDMYIHYR